MKKTEAITRNLKEKISYALSAGRSASYFAQNLAIPLIERLATHGRLAREGGPKNQIKILLRELDDLLKKDSHNISIGLYPLGVLGPFAPFSSLKTYAMVLRDAYGIAKRKDTRQTKEFNVAAEEFMADVPDYYKRNFHFQTNGYLSEDSARIYEHQVEILFSGAANPMRRLIIPAMYRYIAERSGSNVNGAGFHFLEVGAGTGSLTRFIKMAFPQLRITVLDLSDPYLGLARENLKTFSKLNFVQGDAAKLPFKNQMFDGVFSCFLFHELPLEIRQAVLSEGLRVLKPEGFYGMVDSIQINDFPSLNWAIERFPADFHEPFYKNYIENPMENLMKSAGISNLQQDRGFLSKSLVGLKPS